MASSTSFPCSGISHTDAAGDIAIGPATSLGDVRTLLRAGRITFSLAGEVYMSAALGDIYCGSLTGEFR